MIREQYCPVCGAPIRFMDHVRSFNGPIQVLRCRACSSYLQYCLVSWRLRLLWALWFLIGLAMCAVVMAAASMGLWTLADAEDADFRVEIVGTVAALVHLVVIGSLFKSWTPVREHPRNQSVPPGPSQPENGASDEDR